MKQRQLRSFYKHIIGIIDIFRQNIMHCHFMEK